MKYVIAKYVRLSLEDAKYDSLSIANQHSLLDNYIETLGVENAEILEFVDNGHSGTNFERPAVQELLELVKCSKVQCIVVKDFSRFGRNSIEMGYFIEKVFPIYNVRFISINDSYDSENYNDDTGGIEVVFKYLVNEIYSHDLSKKTKSAKYAKMRRGEYQQTNCFYGYKKSSNGHLEIDEVTAPVVRMIFELSAENKNTSEIIKALYANKILTPGEYKASKGYNGHNISKCCNVWSKSSVLNILNDERYTGMYIMGKRSVTEIGGKNSRLKDESEWIKIPDHHPAIITEDLYHEANEFRLRFKLGMKKSHAYPLKGKVFCGCCQHTLGRRKQDPILFCDRYTKIDDSAECSGLQIKQSELEKLIFEIIAKQAEILSGTDNTSNADNLVFMLKEQSEHEQQMRQIMDEKRRLYEQSVLGEIDDETYLAQKSVCDAKLNKIKESHSGLVSKTAKIQINSDKISELKAVAKAVTNEKSLTRELVEALIDKVEIFPEKRVDIFWKIQDFFEEHSHTA